MEPKPTIEEIKETLEYLRGEIQKCRISYEQIAILQGFSGYIEPGDVELLEWAGVPEFPEDELTDEQRQTLAEVRKLGYVAEFRPEYDWIIYDPANGLTLADVIYAADNDGLYDIESITLVQNIPGVRMGHIPEYYFGLLAEFVADGTLIENKIVEPDLTKTND
jgi:hypothetical protein